jgi:hypothetical protein
MNLQENLNRIKQVMGLMEEKVKYDRNTLTAANPKSPLYHSSSYKNRDNILKNGLTPKLGTHTSNYIGNNYNGEVETIPLIWAMALDANNLFGAYGGDVWEIDLTKANVKWYIDFIHQNDVDKKEFYVTPDSIPPSAIKLIKSDEQSDNDKDAYLKTGVWPNREPIEEPKIEEPTIWQKLQKQMELNNPTT